MLKNNEKNIIKKIYHNDFEDMQEIVEDNEYRNISKKIQNIEKNILRKLDCDCKKDFEKYLEYVTYRESLDAENQFVNGFKTAVKIIIGGLS